MFVMSPAPCPDQPRLLDFEPRPPLTEGPPNVAASETAPKPKLKPIDRSQGFLRPVIVEELVGAEHKVRAIWDLTGQLDLSRFLEKIRSKEGKAGRRSWAFGSSGYQGWGRQRRRRCGVC
jgi:hypothetical protein